MIRRGRSLVIPATLRVAVLGATVVGCSPHTPVSDAGADTVVLTDTTPPADTQPQRDTGVDVATVDTGVDVIPTDTGVDVATVDSGVDVASLDALTDVPPVDANLPTGDVIIFEGGVVCLPPFVIPEAGTSCGTCYNPNGMLSDCALCPDGPDGSFQQLC